MDAPGGMLNPESLPNEKLKEIIRRRQLKIACLNHMSKEQLVNIYERYCKALGQRKNRKNWRGKLLNRSRNVSQDNTERLNNSRDVPHENNAALDTTDSFNSAFINANSSHESMLMDDQQSNRSVDPENLGIKKENVKVEANENEMSDCSIVFGLNEIKQCLPTSYHHEEGYNNKQNKLTNSICKKQFGTRALCRRLSKAVKQMANLERIIQQRLSYKQNFAYASLFQPVFNPLSVAQPLFQFVNPNSSHKRMQLEVNQQSNVPVDPETIFLNQIKLENIEVEADEENTDEMSDCGMQDNTNLNMQECLPTSFPPAGSNIQQKKLLCCLWKKEVLHRKLNEAIEKIAKYEQILQNLNNINYSQHPITFHPQSFNPLTVNHALNPLFQPIFNPQSITLNTHHPDTLMQLVSNPHSGAHDPEFLKHRNESVPPSFKPTLNTHMVTNPKLTECKNEDHRPQFSKPDTVQIESQDQDKQSRPQKYKFELTFEKLNRSVVIGRDDGVKLGVKDVPIIRKRLIRLIEKAGEADVNSQKLAFEQSRVIKEGLFLVTPKTKDAMEWLLACNFGDLNGISVSAKKYHSARGIIWIPNKEKFPNNPMSLLRGQNKDKKELRILEWGFYRQLSCSRGTLMLVGIPMEVAKMCLGKKLCLNFQLTQVCMKVKKLPKPKTYKSKK